MRDSSTPCITAFCVAKKNLEEQVQGEGRSPVVQFAPVGVHLAARGSLLFFGFGLLALN
jgi:hypothetical protein